jgi:hypothetical protein
MSKIRKIQPIDADASLSARRKLAAMTPKEREDNGTELARRERLADIAVAPIVRCDMVEVENFAGDGVAVQPLVFGSLPRGCGGGIIAELPDGSVYVALSRVKAVPPELDRVRGVVKESPSKLLLDAAYPQVIANPVGHRSYQDTKVIATDGFTEDRNPLEGGVWTKAAQISGTLGMYSSDGTVQQLRSGTSSQGSLYRHSVELSNANYSTQLVSDNVRDGTYRADTVTPCVRLAESSDTFYGLWHYDEDGGNVHTYKRYNGGQTNFAILKGVGTGQKTLRIEVSGTGDSVYLKGYYGGEEVYQSATDTSHNRIVDINYAGIRGYSRNNPTSIGTGDDFAVLQGEATGGARGLDAGAFGLGRGGRGLSPNGAGL